MVAITAKTTYEELLASGEYFTPEQMKEVCHKMTLDWAEELRKKLRNTKRNIKLNKQEYAKAV